MNEEVNAQKNIKRDALPQITVCQPFLLLFQYPWTQTGAAITKIFITTNFY